MEDGTVERSNRIIQRLQVVAAGFPRIRQQLAELPRWRGLVFGGLKVLVLHGDPESLAGWKLSREAIRRETQADRTRWLRQTGADLVICTHTCLPYVWQAHVEGRDRLVLNNGSAGMGNLRDDSAGLAVLADAGRFSAAGLAQTVRPALAGGLRSLRFLPFKDR